MKKQFVCVPRGVFKKLEGKVKFIDAEPLTEDSNYIGAFIPEELHKKWMARVGKGQDIWDIALSFET